MQLILQAHGSYTWHTKKHILKIQCAQTKVRSSTRSSLEDTPEMENVSSLNIAERTSRNLQEKQTKELRVQWINHFCQHAVDHNLDIGVLLFTLLAWRLDFEEVTSPRVVICLKDLDFQQVGKSKPWKDLTLSISPKFKYFWPGLCSLDKFVSYIIVIY